MVVSQEDLDNFLTTVESKVRGPFSSLDLARAVTSTRGLSPRQYLEQLQKVFPRMDKVTKLRVLIALLGLDPSDDTDDIVYEICADAQEERLSEEWVKVIAGLNQGIMFQDEHGARESCRGEEAQRLLEKSCAEILEGVKDEPEKDDPDPLFSPHMYSLLNADLLQQVLPECLTNRHFTTNLDAEILKIDERLEQQKAADGASVSVIQSKNPDGNGATVPLPKPEDLPTMPGIKSLTRKPKAAPGKSSMFLTSKKPMSNAAARPRPGTRPGQLGNQFNTLRKPGTARALLAKSRVPGAQTTTGGATTAQGKFGANRSKMKMVGLDEAQALQNEIQQRNTAETSKEARKRKLMEQMKGKGLVSKKSKLGTSAPTKAAAVTEKEPMAPEPQTQQQQHDPQVTGTPGGVGAGGGMVAAALAAYQNKQTNGPDATPLGGQAPPSGEWTQHLDKSNRLTQEDRERVRQFFVDRINPTPDVPVCRLKLHEEKTVEPGTGLTVKETLYLELDYNTFTFKKLRKTKKK